MGNDELLGKARTAAKASVDCADGEILKCKKRKYDSADSKRRLLRAGIDVFSKEGFDAASTRQIAKKAGVNDSLIHRYFESKIGLFFAILREFHQHMVQAPGYEQGKTLEEELFNFFMFRREFAKKEQKFMRLWITRAIVDPKVREEMQLLKRNGTPRLVSRLMHLQEEGKLRKDLNVDHVGMLIGALDFGLNFMTNIICVFKDVDVESLLKMSAQVLAQGLASKADDTEAKGPKKN